jgi:hypothetical protein
VIAERDEVNAGVAQLAVDRRRQAGAVDGVLGVGDDEVDAARGISSGSAAKEN